MKRERVLYASMHLLGSFEIKGALPFQAVHGPPRCMLQLMEVVRNTFQTQLSYYQTKCGK